MDEKITENSGAQMLEVAVAIEELTRESSYRDITALMRRINE